MAHQAFTVELFPSDVSPQLRLRAAGRLTTGAGVDHPAWRRLLADGDAVHVTLDLAAVCRIDAAGVGLLAQLCAAVHRRGGRVELAAVSDRVETMLRITGVDLAFDRPTPPARVVPFRCRSVAPSAARQRSPQRRPVSVKPRSQACARQAVV